MSVLYQVLIAPIEWVMHMALSAIFAVTGSYGVSIFLLSLLINAALLPLFQLAERWQEAERRIQKQLAPKLEQFKQAFSGEERHVMIHTLYRQAGYHPIYAVRSSIGLFLQLPFWIAAYQLLSHYQPLNGASFLAFDDLGQPDRLLGGVNLLPFVMTAVNLTAAVIYTNKLSRAEQVQPVVLAVLFLVLLYDAPSGLLLYWTFNSLFSLLRIAFLNPTQVGDPTRADLKLSSPEGTPQLGMGMNPSDAQEQLGRAMTAGAVPTEVGHHGTTPPSRGASAIINLALILLVMVVQASVHLDRFALEGGLLHKSNWLTWGLLATSIVVLVYLCWAYPFKHAEATKRGWRPRLSAALVWLLCGALGLSNVVWLSALFPDFHPAKVNLGILLPLVVLLISPFCDRIPITKNMPDDHWLFAGSMLLSTFVLFLGNPIGIYVSSSDFVGGVSHVAAVLGVLFVIVSSGVAALYVLVDSAAKKILSLLFVFLAIIIMAYSAVGVRNAGVMSQFILPLARSLIRTNQEIVMEALMLLVVLAVTSYATVRYRQNVRMIMGAMLVASIGVTFADLLSSKGNEVSAKNELPVAHADIVNFSREGNVLILMLDGFPGAYLPRIMDEVPEVLREFDGFTWFPNIVTTSADTLGAIATLAGGPLYKPEEINKRHYESVGHAINESYGVYIDAFVPGGFQVSYVNPAFAGGCDRLDKRIYCTDTVPYGIHYRRNEEPALPVVEGDSHVPLILAMVSVVKAAPFFLKSWVYQEGNYLGMNAPSVRHAVANSYKVKDWGFLRVLSHESRSDSKSKTFKFIQLVIPHPPNALDANCELRPEGATIYTESVCALKEVGRLLSWMKKAGVYDSTKILVVSDHGWFIENPMFPSSFDTVHPKLDGWMSMPGIVQPLLLMKDFKARGIVRRSDILLSNSDVPSIVCSSIGGCMGVGPDPTRTQHEDRTLTFSMLRYPPEEELAKKFNILTLYEVKRNIFDPQNWRRIQ